MTISIDRNITPNPLIDIAARMMLFLKTALAANDDTERERRFLLTIDRYSNVINKVCYTYAFSHDDFQDLRQDVLVNVWRGMDNFRGDSSPMTWIYRIALNTCVSDIRKCKDKKTSVPLELIGDTSDENEAIEKERIEALHSLISLLDPDEKAIIMMRLDDFKYEEIAEVMGLHRNTIATRIHRIKDKLKNLYKNDQV